MKVKLVVHFEMPSKSSFGRLHSVVHKMIFALWQPQRFPAKICFETCQGLVMWLCCTWHHINLVNVSKHVFLNANSQGTNVHVTYSPEHGIQARHIYIYLSQGGSYSTPGNISDQLVLRSISPQLNCSIMQQQQQTFGHNNIPILEWQFSKHVCMFPTCIVHLTMFAS